MPPPRLYQTTVNDHMLSLQELHDLALVYVEEEFARRGTTPFLWLIDLGHEIIWIETPWDDDAEKIASTKIIQLLLREFRARAYTQLFEAWASTETGKQGKTIDDAIREAVPPSERPKNERDDVLLAITMNKAGEQIVSRYLVTQRRHGLNFLGPRVNMIEEYGHMTGRMFDLFKKMHGACPMCGLTLGHKDQCPVPVVAAMFAGKP